ncbi:hypothetical protein RJT34_13991 [Clitoria ternatea]|uniref:Uncharacterized protein n=1 Tax=Clitoria ternatea TaxID=43366 RepID=A0AAN9PMR6_CLITE
MVTPRVPSKTKGKQAMNLVLSDTRFCNPSVQPRFRYDKNFNPNSEVLYGLYQTIERVVLDKRKRFIIDQQLQKFKGAKGLFGMSMLIYGRVLEEIAKSCEKLAMRILSVMYIHECFGLDKETPSKKMNRGLRSLNTKEKSIIGDSEEIEVLEIKKKGKENMKMKTRRSNQAERDNAAIGIMCSAVQCRLGSERNELGS